MATVGVFDDLDTVRFGGRHLEVVVMEAGTPHPGPHHIYRGKDRWVFPVPVDAARGAATLDPDVIYIERLQVDVYEAWPDEAFPAGLCRRGDDGLRMFRYAGRVTM